MQESLLSPRLAGHQPNANFYDNSGVKHFSQGADFGIAHQNQMYNNYEMKGNAQNVNQNWEQGHFPQNSPQFKAQMRSSPNPLNWQSQKYDNSGRYTSTPKLQPTSRYKRRIWPLIKGNLYETEQSTVHIRDVWEENVEEEMELIRKISERFNYIAIDTEFPGIVAKPSIAVAKSDFQYHMLRSNVDLLTLIQLGMSFSNAEGELVKLSDLGIASKRDIVVCWQFHFNFSLSEELYSSSSIKLLQNSGIKFDLLDNHGIDPIHFGELLISSGLVLLKNVHWITFHGLYDFGYLLKVLTNKPLPLKKTDFDKLLKMYFHNVYDIKYIKEYNSSLEKLAERLSINRVGPSHQAGSDSLITLQVFNQIIRDETNKSRFGVLHGLE